MTVRTTLAALLLATAAAAPLPAQTVVGPDARTGIDLTVYRGFGQVVDERRADVPAAPAELVWTGVPRGVDPGTIALLADGRPAATSLARYEPATDAGDVLRAAVGRPVVLVSPGGERTDARLVSPNGPVFAVGDRLVLDWKGSWEVAVGDAGPVSGARFRFRVESPAGRHALSASYLLDGLDWSADYVAILQPDETAMTLDGRMTVSNSTDTDFDDANVELVAGDVNRAGGGGGRPVLMAEARAAAAPAPQREPFAGYHLYRLPDRISLPAGATTRIPLFSATRVPVEREFLLEGGGWIYRSALPQAPPAEHPRIVLRFENRDVAGDDEPLPAGTLHTYRLADGRLRFAGSAPIPDTPSGEKVEATVGAAFDLVAERTQTDFRRIDPNTTESAWRIEIRNHAGVARTVTVVESFPGEWTILEESAAHEEVDASTARWKVAVPAGGRTALTYRVRTSI